MREGKHLTRLLTDTAGCCPRLHLTPAFKLLLRILAIYMGKIISVQISLTFWIFLGKKEKELAKWPKMKLSRYSIMILVARARSCGSLFLAMISATWIPAGGNGMIQFL